MELFKVTLLAAMAILMFLTAASSVGKSGAEKMTMPSSSSSSSSSDEYHDDMSPSLRRLARAIVAHGSWYGHDNHKQHHPGHAGTGRLAGCDTNPSICHKTNHTLQCCGKRCVDVKTDEFNCGHCKNKCHYRYKCCDGNCVDVMYDKHNCGSCDKKCKNGKCVYGMCSYST